MFEEAPVIWGCPVIWGVRWGGVTCYWGCICSKDRLILRTVSFCATLHRFFGQRCPCLPPEVLAKSLGRCYLIKGLSRRLLDKQSFSLPLSLGLQNQDEGLAETWGYVKHHAWYNEKNFLAGETKAQSREASCPGVHKLMVPEPGIEPDFPLDLQPMLLCPCA